jgi:hypothetical protein
MDFGERHPGIDSVITVVDRPIQWVMGGIQVVLGLLFVIACCILLPIYGYLRGPALRAEANAYFATQDDDSRYARLFLAKELHPVKDHTVVYTIDYTHPMVTAQYKKLDENYNDIVVDVSPAYFEYSTLNSGSSHSVNTAFPFTATTAKYGNMYAPNPGCDEYIRQRYMSPDSWWSFSANGGNFDRVKWAEGKQAPMYAAYVRAAAITWALQDIVSRLKVSESAMVAGWSSNFCTTPVDASIMMPGAPVIKMAWADGGLGNDGSLKYPNFLVLGICLANECRPEAFQYTTDRDMFSDPSVNEYQQHAIDALDAMQTDAFWLRVAHANGITHRDYVVELAASSNREHLKTLVRPISQNGDTNYTYKNYALAVRNAILFGYLPVAIAVIIVWRLVKTMIREHKEEEQQARRARLVPVQVIPPPQRSRPRLSEAQRQQLQEQVTQMEGSVAAFNRTLIRVPEGHPMQAQAEDTARKMEETVRMLAELRQLLKTISK